ncbi:MAG: site-specific DNA-methyltransferase, partial [Bacteroidetes bacterium]|nr:site-specific DNA-methyltransferase [Bacteroidota bacterium]
QQVQYQDEKGKLLLDDSLVEVGEQFDTVLLPRIKKVAFSSKWKKGKPHPSAEADTSLRIIKYLRLESYEDALDSIEFEQKDASKLESIIEDYTLKYMLKWETKDCETFLNPTKLFTPFDYQLNLYVNGEKSSRMVDITETFNYLLGMKVQTRKVHMDDNRRYLVLRGETREHPNRITVIIWRDTVNWKEIDLARDKQFVNEKKITVEADVIYVNGMSSIVGAKPIEPIFKDKMFANVSKSPQ